MLRGTSSYSAIARSSDLANSSAPRKDYSFSMDTSVALITANTSSPAFSFIRSTEPVVIIDVTIPAAVRMTISDTTLSERIFSIVPGKRFRILVLMVVRRMYYRTPSTVIIMPLSSCFTTWQ